MLFKQKKTFSFTPSNILGAVAKWLIGLVSLELDDFIFNTAENNNFEIYADLVDDFAYTVLKDELEETLGLSDNSPEHLQAKNNRNA